MTVEIVLLAMIALFVGLRLYSVLGRRTGHEQQPVTRPETIPVTGKQPAFADAAPERSEGSGLVYDERAAAGVRAIIAADPAFDMARFLESSQTAYRMILEGFWKGEMEDVADFVGGDVRASFTQAIADRQASGHVLDNRLIAIDRAHIEDARLDGRDAGVTVRFDASIAAITRDESGEVIAGSLSDAVETHDLWTFRRTIGSTDPNWILVETEAA